MSVRRRAIKARMERDRKARESKAEWDRFYQSLEEPGAMERYVTAMRAACIIAWHEKHRADNESASLPEGK